MVRWELSISITNSMIRGSWWPEVVRLNQEVLIKWRFGYVNFNWWGP